MARSVFQRTISSDSVREAAPPSIVRMAVRVAASGSATDQRRRFDIPTFATSSASTPASSAGPATLLSSKLGWSSPAGSWVKAARLTANRSRRRSSATAHAPSPDRPMAAGGSFGATRLLRGFIRIVGSRRWQ